jgi:hypothetical protein
MKIKKKRKKKKKKGCWHKAGDSLVTRNMEVGI